MTAITAQTLGVRFMFDRQQRVITPLLGRLRRHGSVTWGIRDLCFRIGPGEGVALLGRSGSGKTTLLRALAGVYVPDDGRLDVGGRVASLLSIDAGLAPSLTGRENAQLLCVLASASASAATLDEVKKRTGLGDAYERPVSSFSQGMRARLGFAVAEQIVPDVLLLDEVHEALDHEYRAVVERCAVHVRANGGIVVAAGHDHDLLERMCGRAMVLEGGGIIFDGTFAHARTAYLGSL